MYLKQIKHIHFIGIGGAGLSALARLCKGSGLNVSGSDIKETELTNELEKENIKVFIGQVKENISPTIDLVIKTSAIKGHNEETQAARDLGIPVYKRDYLLGLLMEDYKGIAIAGTHGKTTTTALVTHLLNIADINPTYLIGGISLNYNTNADLGKNYFVIEADEFDRAFWSLHPYISVITSLEMDHPDCYKDIEDYTKSFDTFLKQTAPDGITIGCGDYESIHPLLRQLPHSFTTYGMKKDNQWYVENINTFPGYTTFDVYKDNKFFENFTLNIPGEHNVVNSLVGIIIGTHLNIPINKIKESLKTFKGTKRRFEILGSPNDILVVDDYAHHPTAVEATIEAALSYKRPIRVVYEPHQFARTALLLNDYKNVFKKAAAVYLSNIYASRDKDTTCVSIKDLHELIKMNVSNSFYFDTHEDLAKKVASDANKGDLILVMGVGNGDIIAKKILSKLG